MFTSPVWRLLFNQRLMVERETPRSSWTSFLGMPRSIAASVFNLRSFEYAFMRSILIQVRYLPKPLLDSLLQDLTPLLEYRAGSERPLIAMMTGAPPTLSALPRSMQHVSPLCGKLTDVSKSSERA